MRGKAQVVRRDGISLGREDVEVVRLSAGRARVRRADVSRRLRDVGVFVSSLAVVALLVLYAVAGGGIRLAAVADRVVVQGSSAGVVVSGRVLDQNGNGVDHAIVLASAAGRPTMQAISSRGGLFRVGLSGACARYEVSLIARLQARTLQARLHRTLCPGELLRVRARVVSSGQFLWMPR
jgi:hypothetical protein